MKALFFLLAVSIVIAPRVASACGTHPPAVQSKINAEELAKLQQLAGTAAHEAEEIFIGTVTELIRPTQHKGELGSVSFAVEETIKGQASSTRTAQWRDRFVYSCQPSAMFHNVGFRPDGRFVVYIRSGKVMRSEAADHLRTGLLSLEQERTIAAGAGGS